MAPGPDARVWLIVLLVAAPGWLAGCSRQREVRLDLRWDLTSTGLCSGAGEGMGEKEITLRYVKSPDYFEKLCSNKVADHLLANGKNPVPGMILYDARTKGRSLCEVDIVQGTRVGDAAGQSCTELGFRVGGIERVGGAAPSPDGRRGTTRRRGSAR